MRYESSIKKSMSVIFCLFGDVLFYKIKIVKLKTEKKNKYINITWNHANSALIILSQSRS